MKVWYRRRTAVFCVTFLVTLLVGSVGYGVKYIDKDGRTELSLVRLLANPEAFHGKRVRVKGFVTAGFENSAIFLSASYHEWGILSNAIWLKMPKMDPISARQYDRTYMSVVGTFDARACGHMCLYSGSLSNIEALIPAVRTNGASPKK